MIVEGLDEAIDLANAHDAAEKIGSPLNNLHARVSGGTDTMDDIGEFAGRQCYRSWEKGRPSSEYHANILDMGHGSIYQHAQVSIQITGISRSLSHELVRHGTGTGFSQESQRYVDAKDIRFVVPPITVEHLAGMTPEEMEDDEEFTVFRKSCHNSLREYIAYQQLIAARLAVVKAAGDYKDVTEYKKRANEAARSLLHNACETRMVFTANLRSMRHILTLRGTAFADLEIRRLAPVILNCVRQHAPHFFAAVEVAVGEDGRAIINALNGKV
jgi:thymidylate synthase (FAD)